MRTRSSTRLVPALVASITLAFLVGCSFGTDAVSRDEVESVAASELAEQVGADEPPNISCPEDLDAEVGATMTCELSVEGDDDVYPVEIKVTSVEDGDVNFDVEVEDTPVGG